MWGYTGNGLQWDIRHSVYPVGRGMGMSGAEWFLEYSDGVENKVRSSVKG